jgi:hypothetical protein
VLHVDEQLAHAAGKGSHSSRPMCELSSSTSPMAAMRGWNLGTRVLSPRPVLPSSPVRVAICVSRLPMVSVVSGFAWPRIVRQRAPLSASQPTRFFTRRTQMLVQATAGKSAGSLRLLQCNEGLFHFCKG